jgi:DNA-binding response OmpR family regulator
MSINVLVIDDDLLVRGALQAVLESAGYSVTCAVDGRQGLAEFRKRRPDLVITDIIMPEKEGLEMIIAMRAEWPEGPIIAISGGGRVKNSNFLEMAKKFGANATLEKPFEPEDLIAQVKSCCGPHPA